MDLDQLRGFYYAAKLRSFTEAAEKLYLTQPAISLQVKALEREVGERLFDRTGRTVRLTPVGEILYNHAEEVVGKIDEIKRLICDFSSLEIGQLRLGASDTTSIYFLPELLKAFRTAHPKVEVIIDSLFSHGVARKVLDREVDVGIVTLPQDDQRLEVVPFFSERMVAIVYQQHPLARYKSIRISDLVEHPLILLGKESASHQRTLEYLNRARKQARVAMELSNFEIVRHYVAHGLGISLVPERAAASPMDGVVAVPLRQRLTIEAGAVYRGDRKLSRTASVFLDMAKDHFAGTQAPGRHPRRGASAPVGDGAVGRGRLSPN